MTNSNSNTLNVAVGIYEQDTPFGLKDQLDLIYVTSLWHKLRYPQLQATIRDQSRMAFFIIEADKIRGLSLPLKPGDSERIRRRVFAGLTNKQIRRLPNARIIIQVVGTLPSQVDFLKLSCGL